MHGLAGPKPPGKGRPAALSLTFLAKLLDPLQEAIAE